MLSYRSASNELQIRISILSQVGSIAELVAFESRVRDHRRIVGTERRTGELQIQPRRGSCFQHPRAESGVGTDTSANRYELHSRPLGGPNRLLHQNVDDGFLERGA